MRVRLWQKPVTMMLIGLCATTLCACASTGISNSDLTSKADDFKLLTDDAAQAYSTGDLSKAEALFTQIQAAYPEDPRAVYNLAMLNLQRAFEGLQRFVSLEKNPELQQRAEGLLQRLAGLRQH